MSPSPSLSIPSPHWYTCPLQLRGAGSVVVVVAAGMATTTLATVASMLSPIVPASPLLKQPPLISAFSKDVLNFVSALSRQRSSTGMLFPAAFAWQVSFPAASLPAAFNFACAHEAAGSVAAAGGTHTVTRARADATHAAPSGREERRAWATVKSIVFIFRLLFR